MRLPRRHERRLDAQVELEVARPEPAPTARGQMRRLLDARETQHARVERLGLGFALRRHGQLHVMVSLDRPALRVAHSGSISSTRLPKGSRTYTRWKPSSCTVSVTR